jgi:hypothetical protein
MKLRLIVAVLAPLWLANCATIVEGTDQAIQVATVPSGASCALNREGASVGVIDRTPASVTLSKSKNSVEVVCNKPGYREARNHLYPGFQGMTFGNVILGGFVGVAIDAGSGAMHKYPPAINLVLSPKRFQAPKKQDAYFDNRIPSVRNDTEEGNRAIVRECSIAEGQGGGCVSMQKQG